MDYSDYPKSLFSRINEVYVLFNKISLAIAIFYWKKKHINFNYNRLFCYNHTCHCVNMVSVTSASRYMYITSASRYHPSYQSRSSMLISGFGRKNIEAIL